MKNLKQTLLIGLALVGMNAVPVVYAQSNSGVATAAANGEPGHVRSPQEAGKWLEKRREQMAKHQAELHDKLKITAAQEPAWKVFTQAMMPASMAESPNNKDVEKLTTPERMALTLEKLKHSETMMQSRLEAVKNFYAALNADQQKTFDESHNRMRKEMQERMAKLMEKDGGSGMMK